MDNQEVLQILNPIINDFNNPNVISEAYLYVFKATPITNNKNTHVALDYNFYDTSMGKDDVMNAIKTILLYFKDKCLIKDTTTYTEYNINNPSNTIDYLKIEALNFTEPAIANGIEPTIDSNNYKINYFLYQLNTNNLIANSKKQYRGLKYTAFKFTTRNNHNLYIINKNNPLYKPQKLIFSLDLPETDDTNIAFKPIKNYIFKIPFHPSLIIIDNYCFMIDKNIESVFGFEESNKRLRDIALTDIKDNLIINDESFNIIDTFSHTGNNHNIFVDYQNDILMKIKNGDNLTKKYLKQLHVDLNTNGEIIINSKDIAKNFLNFLCGNITIELYTKNLCVTHKISNIQ